MRKRGRNDFKTVLNSFLFFIFQTNISTHTKNIIKYEYNFYWHHSLFSVVYALHICNLFLLAFKKKKKKDKTSNSNNLYQVNKI